MKLPNKNDEITKKIIKYLKEEVCQFHFYLIILHINKDIRDKPLWKII